MISYIHIIEALLLLSGALNSGGVVPPNNHCDIENFLRANGCENLVPGFIAEEIEMYAREALITFVCLFTSTCHLVFLQLRYVLVCKSYHIGQTLSYT